MAQTIHLRSLLSKGASFANEAGSIARIDVNDFPVLKKLSLRRLLLSARGVREPHWHANANELGYCLRGDHLVTIAGSHSTRDSFTISRGQMFFVPSGALHHIENVGEDEGEFILGFSSEQVEDFGLSGTFGAFTDAVLGNTTGLPGAEFAGLKRSARDIFIGLRAGPALLEDQARHINPYKYDLEAAQPPDILEIDAAREHLDHPRRGHALELGRGIAGEDDGWDAALAGLGKDVGGERIGNAGDAFGHRVGCRRRQH